MGDLFRYGSHTLHSGGTSALKLDCDAFNTSDWTAIGRWLKARLEVGQGRFGRVYGIPNGGTRLASEMDQYADAKCSTVLLCDDVMTTGASFLAAQAEVEGPHIGVCVFARGDRVMHPVWVTPMLVLPNDDVITTEWTERNVELGAMMSCGCWWYAKKGSTTHTSETCPLHNVPVAVVATNIPLPEGWTIENDWSRAPNG